MIREIRGRLPKLKEGARMRAPSWVFYLLPFSLSVAILIAPGPYLYEVLFNPIEVHAPAVNRDYPPKSSIALPSLETWFSYPIHWHLLWIGLAAAVFSLEGRNLRKMAFNAAMISFVGLMLHGLSYEVYQDGFSFEELIRRTISSLAGSAILFIVFAVQIYTYSLISKREGHRLSALFSASTSIIIISSFLSLLLYCVIFFLFQPLAVDYRGRSEIPFRGTYFSEKKEDFSFLPSPLTDVSLAAEGAESRVQFSWKKKKTSAGFDLAIAYLADCFTYKQARSLDLTNHRFEYPNASSISMTLDKGSIGIETDHLERSSIEFLHKFPTFYWVKKLEPDDGSNTVGVTNFMAEESALRGDTKEKLEFFFRLPLLSSNDETTRPSPRSIELLVDGLRSDRLFSPHHNEEPIDPDSELNCRALNKLEDGELEQVPDMTSVSLVITLSPSVVPTREYSRYDSNFRISGLQGWASVNEIDKDDFESEAFGEADLLAVNALKEVVIDGIPKPIDSDMDFVALGKTYLTSSQEGGVRFSGRSDRVWLDGKLMNQSYWDSLELELKIAIIGWIGALFWLGKGFISNLVQLLRTKKFVQGIPRNW